ncbi:hypothetical protein ACFS3C_25105 [Azotobacter vinelandii]
MTNRTDDEYPEAPSDRTHVKRYHWLARYDQETVKAILDATPLAHVGCMMNGVPFVTPHFLLARGGTGCTGTAPAPAACSRPWSTRTSA